MITLDPGRSVTVEVPATSANLGPGFDCCGLALDWRERIRLESLEHGFEIEVSGEGAAELPRDESHLIIQSALVGLADLGVGVGGLRLVCHNTIPHGSGLGSSSAAIVGGLLAAAGLADAEPGPDWLLRHAYAIEGHPDNVAAAVYGGFVLAYEGRDGITVAASPVAGSVGAAVFVPDQQVETRAARGLLPEMVPHVDAAANSGRSALLVYALAHDPERLYDATRDWLHQSYREPAMPRSYELMKALRERQFAAVISGSGPSVLVLGRASELVQLEAFPAAGFLLRLSAVGGAATMVEAKCRNAETPQR